MIYGSRTYRGKSAILSGIGAASVFTIVGFIGVIFALTPVDFIGLSNWGYYMFIPAFFIWLGVFGSYFSQQRIRRDALAALESYKSAGTTNLDALAINLLMDRDSLMRLLIDLRADGEIKFRMDSKSGEITFE